MLRDVVKSINSSNTEVPPSTGRLVEEKPRENVHRSCLLSSCNIIMLVADIFYSNFELLNAMRLKINEFE